MFRLIQRTRSIPTMNRLFQKFNSNRHDISNADNIANELYTIKDFVRYAFTKFNSVDLAYGQCTKDSLDDAIFLTLGTLKLPVNDYITWADSRLCTSEKINLLNLIDLRISSRTPVAYLLEKAYMHGEDFYVNNNVLIPRSYIGEILYSDLILHNEMEHGHISSGENTLLEENHIIASNVHTVLDLCTGSGCLGILSARIFPNITSIDLTDISHDALKIASKNIIQKDLSHLIHIYQGNLFESIRNNKTYDLIISNPPYVDSIGMKNLPIEYLKEPTVALAADIDGMKFIRPILNNARKYLTKGGSLILEVGRCREAIETEYPSIPFVWLDTSTSTGEVLWIRQEHLPK
eukprot:gene11684-24466_t